MVVTCGGDWMSTRVAACEESSGGRRDWLARSRMRPVTYVSISPVRTYLRRDRESDSAWCWVCMRVGIRPWYMVVRLVRSICRPRVQPSDC